jgi:RNA polymerase sigma-70 factor (ECF subfamily)
MQTLTFEQIYKKYKGNILRYLKLRIKHEMDAEELTSDVMIKVHKSLHLYDENLANLNTWIFNIAKNCMIDFLRKKKVSTIPLDNVMSEWMSGENESILDRIIELSETNPNPEEQMIQQETLDTMYKKLKRGKGKDLEVFELYYVKGLSCEEISQQLQMPIGTVKPRMLRARAKMMEAFPVEMRKTVTL